MKKIQISKLCACILTVLMIFSLFSLPAAAENINLDPGVSEFSYTVSFNGISDTYASAQFDVIIDDRTNLDIRRNADGKVNGVTFSSGLNGIVSDGRMDGNQITYKFGFTSPSGENSYSGGMEICTVVFRYTGVQPRKITICNLEIFRLTGVENGVPQYSREPVDWRKEINVSQRTQPADNTDPSTPGGNTPGTVTPGANTPAAGETSGDTDTTAAGDEKIQQAAVVFTDLDGFDWAKEAIGYIAGKGIIKGDGKGHFRPGENITRADFVLILYRIAGFEAENRVSFEDIPPSQEYRDAIENAAGCGIIKGIDGKRFNPYDNITRQDAAVIVYRLLNYLGKAEAPEGSAKTFNDSEMISAYAKETVDFMVNDGLLQGSGGYLRPRNPITRAEAAVFLYRVTEKYGLLQ